MASMGLLDDIPGRGSRPVAAGQPYFISDGSPVNTFAFLRPLLQSLEYDMPNASIAVPHALMLGKFFWAFYTIMYPWLNKWWLPEPLMLPTEVHKVGVTHYFSLLKARQELGYIPLVNPQEGMAATISYWQDKKRKSLDGPTLLTWILVLGGMLAVFAAAYLPDIGPVPVIRAIALFVFRSIWGIRVLFFLATAAHIGEGIYAYQLAKKVDPANSRGWFLQTTALGMFSLRLLLKRAKK